MQFYDYHLLPLLLILPLLLLLLIRNRAFSRRRYAKYSDEHILSHHLKRISPFNSWMKKLMLIIALGFMILGLLRPQWDHQVTVQDTQGLDIIFCMDISLSMDAADIAPSRLERAKLQAHALLDRMKTDRIGIIAVAGTATLECPLTNDYDAVKLVINSLNSLMAIKGGTNLGQAFEVANTAFNAGSGSNVLILISDGEDLESQGSNQAARLASRGVRIFTMGVGTEAGTVISNPFTGEEAFTRADHRFLQKLAAQGQGEYFDLSAGESANSQLMNSLREHIQNRSGKNRIQGLKEQYHLFVLLAVIALLIESMIIPLRAAEKQE